MKAQIEALVLHAGGAQRRPQLSKALVAAGWSVRDCTLGGLHDLAQVRRPQVLVLDAPAAVLSSLTSAARRTVPSAGLIVLTTEQELDARLMVLDAGADMTCSQQIDVRELAGLGRALARLRGGAASLSPAEASGAARGWHLVDGGRVLTGPYGQRLPLTFAESAFFLRLLDAPGFRMSRDELVPAPPEGVARQSARSVDVLVSRLRAKAHRLGVQLPLLAVRQWGYILLIDGAATGL